MKANLKFITLGEWERVWNNVWIRILFFFFVFQNIQHCILWTHSVETNAFGVWSSYSDAKWLHYWNALCWLRHNVIKLNDNIVNQLFVRMVMYKCTLMTDIHSQSMNWNRNSYVLTLVFVNSMDREWIMNVNELCPVHYHLNFHKWKFFFFIFKLMPALVIQSNEHKNEANNERAH